MIARSALSERYQEKLQIIDVERWESTHCASVREYFCGLLRNCVLDVYNLALATASQPPADHPPLYVESRILIP